MGTITSLMKNSVAMSKLFQPLTVILLTLFAFTSCKEQKEDYPAIAPLSDYMPLAVGKYFIYRLDSTVASTDAKSLEIHRYRVKDSIDAIIKDNEGRDVYRVRRFINDSLGSGSWIDNASFTITPVVNAVNGESIEVVDNNLRFIKLKAPIRDGFSWNGNAYINTTSTNGGYLYLNGWDYTYESIDAQLTLGNLNFPATITVVQQPYTNSQIPSDGVNRDITDTTLKFQEKVYAIEKYAKGTGLVYKEFLYSNFQRDAKDASKYYFSENTYGVKLTMIAHN